MRSIIIYTCLFIYSISYSQQLDIEEMFRFNFGSSKEEVILKWQNSKLSRLGSLSQTSKDTLFLRIDNYRLYNGWRFFFVSDSLFKINYYSTTLNSFCDHAADLIQLKYGEPKISSGFYNWYYTDSKDSSKNKINLDCLPIGDSSRIVISIVNKKLEVRKWDLTINKGFLEGVKGLKWKSSSLDVKQRMKEMKSTIFVLEDSNEYNQESKLIYKNGSFLRFPVKEWLFKFYFDQLYIVELTFQRYAFNSVNELHILVDSLNNDFGEPFSNRELSNGYVYRWYFNRASEHVYIIGVIELVLNFFTRLNQEGKLKFEYKRYLITNKKD